MSSPTTSKIGNFYVQGDKPLLIYKGKCLSSCRHKVLSFLQAARRRSAIIKAELQVWITCQQNFRSR